MQSKVLLNWYNANEYSMPWRENQDPYRIWISEVMLQQTQVKTVIPYYNRWMKKFPTITDVASCNINTLLKYWEGLGYYRRLHHIKNAADIVVNEYSGIMPKGDLLRSLPGIGDYIYSAISSIAYNEKTPVIDGNVKRVASRYWGKNFQSQSELKKLLVLLNKSIDKKKPGDFNQALMDLGREVCKPKQPLCNVCPIEKTCYAYTHNEVELFPVKIVKKNIPIYDVVVAYIEENKKFIITKRPADKMLGGLWELPGGKREKGEKLEQALKREIQEELNISIGVRKKIGKVQHTYSHMKINLHGFKCKVKKGKIKCKQADDLRWINLNEIPNYAFPKANHKLFGILSP